MNPEFSPLQFEFHGDEFGRPRPIWAIRADLSDVNALVDHLQPLADLKDHFLSEVADAFDKGEYAAAEVAAASYEDVAYRLPQLQDIESDLSFELRHHPDFTMHALGRLALIMSGVSVSQERY